MPRGETYPVLYRVPFPETWAAARLCDIENPRGPDERQRTDKPTSRPPGRQRAKLRACSG
ncbi:uncharacterized protein LY79DRAFT_573804 [Colletotrichum navitas]|uniref:Uncharacterized protein n=1 Tax=Colletotrichum navitas TaxID=681940 RepID=A0AAD8PIS7_9PEZI|nr:uncharacterized protein LY79DRAFT_573804 [Colletotrichum navitas]KAK1564006.1 hypothetical protein LY79DRAFT_573804 [Colletotrichum navitas]